MSRTSRYTRSRKQQKKFEKRIKENNKVLNQAKVYEQNK
jgi:transcription elongation GreA/GreB family factor